MTSPKQKTQPAREPKRRIGFDARRVLVVEAALGVFAEHGYQGASLDEIARRAGVTKPVLYDHFDSKRSLYLSLIERERDALLAHIEARFSPDGPPAERVANAVDAVFEYVELHPSAWLMLFRESTGDPETAEVHRSVQQGLNARVIEMILDGAGPDHGDADADLMAAATGELLGGAIRALALWWYDHREVPRDQVVALVMDVHWQGLERFRSGKRWRGRRRRR